MRSSKQRQRNKQNRQNRPSGGNIINRVFDSSGPEGKVRGTPQQIIEKYLQLHRDAQLSGDRVGAENFAQHAEHYTRMLAEAMREVERAREEQEQFHRERQAERERQFEQSRERQQAEREAREQGRDDRREGGGREDRRDDRRPESREDRRDGFAPRDRGDRRFRQPEEAQPSGPGFLREPLFPVLVAEPEDDMAVTAALVETPEDRRASSDELPLEASETVEDRAVQPESQARRPRRTRGPKPESVAEGEAASPPAEGEPRAERSRRPRKPRVPQADPTPDAAE
jgi:hypothetical protein